MVLGGEKPIHTHTQTHINGGKPMKYKKCRDGSYVTNCYILRREADSSNYLFYAKEDMSITAHLNGYAIIPMEKYAELVELARLADDKITAIQFSMEAINEADKDLHK